MAKGLGWMEEISLPSAEWRDDASPYAPSHEWCVPEQCVPSLIITTKFTIVAVQKIPQLRERNPWAVNLENPGIVIKAPVRLLVASLVCGSNKYIHKSSHYCPAVHGRGRTHRSGAHCPWDVPYVQNVQGWYIRGRVVMTSFTLFTWKASKDDNMYPATTPCSTEWALAEKVPELLYWHHSWLTLCHNIA